VIRFLAALLLCVTGVAASDNAGLLTPADLKKAEKLDKRKCWRCHKPYDPSAYDDIEWTEWMDKMSRKAKLKPADDALLRRYFDHTRDTEK
jgi:hypothetical protein